MVVRATRPAHGQPPRGFTLIETLVACVILGVGMAVFTIWTVNELDAIRHDRNELTVQEVLCTQMEQFAQSAWDGPGLRVCDDEVVPLSGAVDKQLPGASLHRTVEQRSPWLKELSLRLDWTGGGDLLKSRELVRLVARREGLRPKGVTQWQVSGDAVLLP